MQYFKQLTVLAMTAAAFAGCKASVNVNAKASADVNANHQGQEADGAEPMRTMDHSMPPPNPVETEFFGVARQLTLKASERKATCSCVAAVVGGAGNPAFDWHGDKPNVGTDALVIAISGDGISCEHKGLGPSISAIDQRGDDVVVVLEEFRDTRPLALGAIIPRPGPNGHVYVRARGSSPYGRRLDGQRGWCRVQGEPGGTEQPLGGRD